jgi:2-keto-4-pentenoate hydratase
LVKDQFSARCAAACGDIVGHKIGCTTWVMQAYLGIPNPCAGGVFGPNVSEISGVFTNPRKGRLGVECEIAVVLERSLPSRRFGYSRREVGNAVRACMCAIEVVEDRYVDYQSLGAPTLIAATSSTPVPCLARCGRTMLRVRSSLSALG